MSYQVFITINNLYSLSFEPNFCPIKITEFCHCFGHGCAGISTLGMATPRETASSDLTKWALNGIAEEREAKQPAGMYACSE